MTSDKLALCREEHERIILGESKSEEELITTGTRRVTIKDKDSDSGIVGQSYLMLHNTHNDWNWVWVELLHPVGI